ncbi:LacI family DNA-binding transcriptional regulator [Nonomuraea sp. NPDC050663]|uniref:LacI family DNA-binding transcriptional regulator n=1 Tax=Nonomuraea sp. NPDC050663 TaxID=3364370 RepID=UPI0037A19771
MTIYDVAQRAGVSISTVSLVMNHPDRVKAGTRARVVEAAGQLGYRPRATASERARERVGKIAVIAPFTSYESYRTRLSGILSALTSSEFEVVVHDTPSATVIEEPLLDALPVRGDVDGMIIMGLPVSEERATWLADWGPPTVLVDVAHPRFSSVDFDNEPAGHLLADHLLRRGHRRLGYVLEPYVATAYDSAGSLRLDGIRRALQEAGGAEAGYHLELFQLTERDPAAAKSALPALLDTAPETTALVAHHDGFAAALLTSARRAGLSVPGQLAIAGFDDGLLADSLDLTTVRQPLVESGRNAADLLRLVIETPDRTPVRITLAPELVVRGTA